MTGAGTGMTVTEAVPMTESILADVDAPRTHSAEGRESLFERFAWVYIFFREKLFRDDTDRFVQALWTEREPPTATQLIELGRRNQSALHSSAAHDGSRHRDDGDRRCTDD